MDVKKNIRLLREAADSDYLLQDFGENMTVSMEEYTARTKKAWNKVMEPFEKTALWEGGAPGYDGRDTLQPEPYLVFIPSEEAETKDTVLIAHGGGFASRTGSEGVQVADWFNRKGFNTAILCYRLEPYTRMDALADMQRGIRVLRMKKEELGIGGKIAVMGFSAGGMLCGNSMTHFDYGNPESTDPAERFSCRPDAAVIGYGAMSASSYPLPFGMVEYDPKMGRTREERLYLAPEKNIRADTPPAFIWQPMSDDGRFGMCLAKAMQDAEIPYELHIFQTGFHGIAMADGRNAGKEKEPHTAHWGELCVEWLQTNGFKRTGGN